MTTFIPGVSFVPKCIARWRGASDAKNEQIHLEEDYITSPYISRKLAGFQKLDAKLWEKTSKKLSGTRKEADDCYTKILLSSAVPVEKNEIAAIQARSANKKSSQIKKLKIQLAGAMQQIQSEHSQVFENSLYYRNAISAHLYEYLRGAYKVINITDLNGEKGFNFSSEAQDSYFQTHEKDELYVQTLK